MLPAYLQAFREAIPKLQKLAAAAKPGVANASTVRDLASAWSSMSIAHDVHSHHEDDVIFPALEALFPGTVCRLNPLLSLVLSQVVCQVDVAVDQFFKDCLVSSWPVSRKAYDVGLHIAHDRSNKQPSRFWANRNVCVSAEQTHRSACSVVDSLAPLEPRIFLVCLSLPRSLNIHESLSGNCIQTRSVGEEHEEHEKLMASVQSALGCLLGGADDGKSKADRVTILDKLKADLTRFGKDVLEHLDHEELYFATPVARKVRLVEKIPYRHHGFIQLTMYLWFAEDHGSCACPSYHCGLPRARVCPNRSAHKAAVSARFAQQSNADVS